MAWDIENIVCLTLSILVTILYYVADPECRGDLV